MFYISSPRMDFLLLNPSDVRSVFPQMSGEKGIFFFAIELSILIHNILHIK